MQFNRGILDEYTTYKELFWRNFFRTDKANIFSVPPSTIMKEQSFTEDFEGNAFQGKTSNTEKYKGNYALSLGPENYICRTAEYPFPAFFKEDGCEKIRYSFRCHFSKEIKQIHVFIQFLDKEGKTIEDVPFYVNEDHILPERWDYKEFGYEIVG